MWRYASTRPGPPAASRASSRPSAGTSSSPCTCASFAASAACPKRTPLSRRSRAPRASAAQRAWLAACTSPPAASRRAWRSPGTTPEAWCCPAEAASELCGSRSTPQRRASNSTSMTATARRRPSSRWRIGPMCLPIGSRTSPTTCSSSSPSAPGARTCVASRPAVASWPSGRRARLARGWATLWLCVGATRCGRRSSQRGYR
mmetsp:Transcript_4566/g.13210  ORF Transcript_4566/g.13210 Transcript_4566/m.13210 type:complete len:203 (+) Transcript_4566:413-1021(+)